MFKGRAGDYRLRIIGIAWLFLVWESYAFVMWTPTIVETSGRIKGRDFAQFYTMGALVREGRADLLQDGAAMTAWLRVHVPEAADYRLQNVYAPQVAGVFALLGGLSYGQALAAWTVISLIVYSAGCWLIIQRAPGLRQRTGTVLIFVAGSPALLLTVIYGHLSAIALFCAAACYASLLSRRRFLAGVAAGALAYKPQLALVLGLVFCLSRDWRALAGAGSAVLAQAAASLVVAPPAVGIAYVQKLVSLFRDPSPVQGRNLALNQSLAGFFNLLVGSGRTATVAYVLTASVAFALVYRVWRSRASLELRFSALVVATVLISPHFFVYDLVLLMVPTLLLVAWATAAGRQGSFAVWTIAPALYLIAPISLFAALRWRVALAPPVLASVLAFLAARTLSVAPAQPPSVGPASS